MWLFQGWFGTYGRLRRIFYTLRRLTGWDHPFSPYVAPLPLSEGSMKRTYRVGEQLLLPLQGEASTTTGTRSTSRWWMRKIKRG